MNLNFGIVVFFIVFIILVSTSYSGILVQPNDCINSNEKIVCYHKVAVSFALENKFDDASYYCNYVKTKEEKDIDTSYPEASKCYRDVAMMLKDYEDKKKACGKIFYELKNSDDEKLCMNEINAEKDKKSKMQNNMCASIFILPAVLFGSLFSRFFIH